MFQSNQVLELGQSFAIIAYGDAATLCLDIAAKPLAHCCALICYYPSSIPHPNQKYPTQMQLVVHLAESQGLVASFSTYNYPGVEDGFAEHDLDQFNAISTNLAWSRDLKAIRRGFKQESNLEDLKDTFNHLTLTNQNATEAVSMLVDDSHVNYVPTATGGIGKRALFHFYKDFFVPGTPPTLEIRLLSRTEGVDQIVDEMIISFRHTQVVPWMLPGVPPTNKMVNIALVSIVAIRGGKLIHEHIYWDQASVLVQIGALDPKFVPKHLSTKGCKRLPILGVDSAKKVMNVNSVPSNGLISNW
jgi:hypothetical protein